MKDYYSHAAYNRWYRQYAFNLDNFTLKLDSLRSTVVNLPWQDVGRAVIEHDIYEIDEKIEQIIPRNFESEGALSTPEIFCENIKVVVNLFCTLCHLNFRFASIYQIEKNRITKEHEKYKFKEKLYSVREKLNRILTEHSQIFDEDMAVSNIIRR